MALGFPPPYLKRISDRSNNNILKSLGQFDAYLRSRSRVSRPATRRNPNDRDRYISHISVDRDADAATVKTLRGGRRLSKPEESIYGERAYEKLFAPKKHFILSIPETDGQRDFPGLPRITVKWRTNGRNSIRFSKLANLRLLLVLLCRGGRCYRQNPAPACRPRGGG